MITDSSANRWYPAAHVSDDHADQQDDQQIDLDDGWCAIAYPHAGLWHWELYDAEVHCLASGSYPYEEGAKNAAVRAWWALR